MPRVLVYGEQDLNLIDGSSVWQASIIEVLAGIDDVSVDVLTRTPRKRDLLVGALAERDDVRFHDPYSPRFPLRELGRPAQARLAPEEASRRISGLDAIHPYDVILLRSNGAARDLLERSPDTLSRCWLYVTRDALFGGDPAGARRLIHSCRRVLSQTPLVEELVRSVVGQGEARLGLLPPMVRIPTDGRSAARADGPLRVVYSGKFSTGYFLEEILDALEETRAAGTALEFHVYGDKFNAPPDDPQYQVRLKTRFEQTDWVKWHGAVAREQVYEALKGCDVGISWRSPEFDDSPEMSTKVLEFSSLGLPVLMNPNRIQRLVFGDDYPCFVASEADVVRVLSELASAPERLAAVGARCRTIAEEYGFEAARRRVRGYLDEDVSPPDSKSPRPRVVLAGHDLKFTREVQDFFRHEGRHELKIDTWLGHTESVSPDRTALLNSADIIWCEWLLGNAVYYARNKRPDQRLIVRLHHQEMELPFRHQIKWESVDALVVICHQHFDRLRQEHPSIRDRIHLIPNLVPCDRFDRPKDPGAQFNLGFMGLAPFRKRPDLALDLLQLLRRQDSRYSLSFKSRHPWEIGWLWDRPEERSTYRQFYERVRELPGVHFEPHGDDVPEWFQRIGYVVSTSDHEGSHQAVAEGMASGAVPILRDWDGADRLYPKEFVFHDLEEAAARILENQHRFAEESESCRAFARREFDAPRIWQLLGELLEGVTA